MPLGDSHLYTPDDCKLKKPQTPPFPVPSGTLEIPRMFLKNRKIFTIGVCVCYAQSWLLLCNPMDYSPPGSSVHVVFQAIEWVAISSSGDLPDPGIEPKSPALAGGFFTTSQDWGELPNLLQIYYVTEISLKRWFVKKFHRQKSSTYLNTAPLPHIFSPSR